MDININHYSFNQHILKPNIHASPLTQTSLSHTLNGTYAPRRPPDAVNHCVRGPRTRLPGSKRLACACACWRSLRPKTYDMSSSEAVWFVDGTRNQTRAKARALKAAKMPSRRPWDQWMPRGTRRERRPAPLKLTKVDQDMPISRPSLGKI